MAGWQPVHHSLLRLLLLLSVVPLEGEEESQASGQTCNLVPLSLAGWGELLLRRELNIFPLESSKAL